MNSYKKQFITTVIKHRFEDAIVKFDDEEIRYDEDVIVHIQIPGDQPFSFFVGRRFNISESEIVDGAIKHHLLKTGELDLSNILNPGRHTDWDDIDAEEVTLDVLPNENAPEMNPYCY